MGESSGQHSVEKVQPTSGEAYYVEQGWSGCAGSAWSGLDQATRDGWEAAAREWLRAVRAECAQHIAERRLADQSTPPASTPEEGQR